MTSEEEYKRASERAKNLLTWATGAVIFICIAIAAVADGLLTY